MVPIKLVGNSMSHHLSLIGHRRDVIEKNDALFRIDE